MFSLFFFQSPVQFEFIPKLDEDELCKPWIKMNPNAGLIMPGKKLWSPIIIIGPQRFAELLPKHKQVFITS